jgi:hypothetical protein
MTVQYNRVEKNRIPKESWQHSKIDTAEAGTKNNFAGTKNDIKSQIALCQIKGSCTQIFLNTFKLY